MEIALAVERHAPAGVLGQRMQHVVQEADARVDGNHLRLAGLRGVCAGGLEQARVGILREFAAVDAEGDLDRGLVCVAGQGRSSDGEGRSHCWEWIDVVLFLEVCLVLGDDWRLFIFQWEAC